MGKGLGKDVALITDGRFSGRQPRFRNWATSRPETWRHRAASEDPIGM